MIVRHDDTHTIKFSVTNDVVHIQNIYVAPQYRNKGIATSIILNLRIEYNLPILLECHDNLLPWYEKIGFRFECMTYDGYNEMILK